MGDHDHTSSSGSTNSKETDTLLGGAAHFNTDVGTQWKTKKTVRVVAIAVLVLALAVSVIAIIIAAGDYNNNDKPPVNKRRKNVVFLLSDDAGKELSVYGNTAIHTPNLHRLATKSLVFDHAYTSVSTCTPSRTAILTGLPSHQSGAFGTPARDFQTYNGVISLPRLLREKGNYRTAAIGKYAVAPDSEHFRLHDFDFGLSPSNNVDGRANRCCAGSDQCFLYGSTEYFARNLTTIKNCVGDFLSSLTGEEPFLLWVGFGDPHRQGDGWLVDYGSDGSIPDWTPQYYTPEEVIVPHYIQDTDSARNDIAGQYTAINRMDQGVGIVLELLSQHGVEEDTLVFYFSDNGPPFTSAKANHFEEGVNLPLIIYHPDAKVDNRDANSIRVDSLVSSLDFFPTILEWCDVKFESYPLFGLDVHLTGKSLLPLFHPYINVSDAVIESKKEAGEAEYAFSSHQFHDAGSSYPMRTVWRRGHIDDVEGISGLIKLTYNLQYKLTYPTAGGVYNSMQHQDLLNNTAQFFRDFDTQYLHRPKYEMFNLTADPLELVNLANLPEFRSLLEYLLDAIYQWQDTTHDGWSYWNDREL